MTSPDRTTSGHRLRQIGLRNWPLALLGLGAIALHLSGLTRLITLDSLRANHQAIEGLDRGQSRPRRLCLCRALRDGRDVSRCPAPSS